MIDCPQCHWWGSTYELINNQCPECGFRLRVRPTAATLERKPFRRIKKDIGEEDDREE